LKLHQVPILVADVELVTFNLYLQLEWPFNTKTITNPRRAATANDAEIKKSFRKLAREFHPTWRRTKSAPEEKFKESTRPTKSCPTQPSAKNMTSWARTGNKARNFVRRPVTKISAANHFADSAGQGRRILNFIWRDGFSDFFEQIFGSTGRRAVLAARQILKDKNLPNAGAMWKATSWSHSKSRTRFDRSVSVLPARAQKHIRSKFRGVTERTAICGSPGAANTVRRWRAGDLYLRVRIAKHPIDVEEHI